MHGTRAANYAMDEADLIVAVGARFDDRITGKLSEFAPRAKFIHIDIDPAEIGKNVPAHIPIVGDAQNILARLLTEYRGLKPDPARLAEWWERIERWRSQHPLRYDDSTDNEIKPQYLVQALYEATNQRRVRPHDRHRPAPDVGGAVLPLRPAAALDPVGWAGDDGLRPPGRDGRTGGPARAADGRALGRRVDPDEHAGAVDARDLRHPREGRDHEQRLPGHGPPVAGAVLGPALLPRGDEPVAGLRQARRGDRLPRRPAGGQDHAGRRPARRARRRGPGRRSTPASPRRSPCTR